jgi:ATP-dependent Clp protease protease subunit
MSQVKKYWDIKAMADGVADVFIYGEISAYKWEDSDTTAIDFQNELLALGEIKTLNIYINSPGGSVFQGQAIYTMLKRHNAEKHVYVDGIAASIASLIAMAGDVVYMPANAMMMIHNPWGISMGDAHDMRKMADELDKIREAMIPAYLNKSGEKLTEEGLVDLLDAESWLTAQECFDYGLCDELLEEKQIAACVDSVQALQNYKNVPEQVLKSVVKRNAEGLDEQTRQDLIAESKSNIAEIKRQLEL